MAHHTGGMHTSAEMQQCIENCQNCHRICIETMSHCLQMGGKHVEPAHMRLMQDCIQICQTSADFMLRGSDLHTRTCAVCAEVCERCAQDCERIDPNDTQMKSCAAMCRLCADSCRRMSSAAAA
jgi:hypothetical protein